MKSAFKVSLKANEKIYINGAVIRAGQKTTLEFLNDVQFLLENHVLQAEDARTPLRQLYFAAQIMLIDPANADKALAIFKDLLPRLLVSVGNERMRAGLKHVDELVCKGQVYEALKEIRALYPLEEDILKQGARKQDDATENTSRALAVGE